jgi:uncharacterized protein (DUF934 family)
MTVQSTIAAGTAARDVYRNGRFEPDSWIRIADDEAIPAEERAFVSIVRFLKETTDGTLGNKPVGVVIGPADRVRDIVPHLERLSAVAIEFPKYNDGRGFSHAAQVKRAGFTGEIRAVGNVLIDQITAMKRQGFTAFEVTHGVTRRYLLEGRDPAPKLYYQPAMIAEAPAGTRPWLRRAV